MKAASFTPPVARNDGDVTFPTVAVTTAALVTVDFGAGASATQTVAQIRELIAGCQAALNYIAVN